MPTTAFADVDLDLDSDIVLWSGVRIADYDTLIVTEEQERSGADASERVVLEGPVERRS